MRSTSLSLSRHALLAAFAAVAAAAGLLAGDARAGGGLPPGQELGTQPGEVDADGFASSDTCRNCHYTGTAIDPYMASDTGAGTMMANSMRDPAFKAALAVANQDTPGVGTFCLRCHSPLSYVRGNATADPSGATSFADEIDAQGVSCEGCHRTNTAPVGGDTPYLLGDARLHYDDVATKRGPYVSCADDPDDPECSESPGHETVQELALGDASFCGQCHQVTIPGRKLRDARGVETAFDFPLDTTYPEWAASAFAPGGPEASTCQDCHMLTEKDGPACNLFGVPEREGLPQHAFVGGNHWGIQAVMQTNPDRVELYAAAFETALTRTLETLRTAATVTIVEVPENAEPGDTIDVTVRVENLTGHKFPTGYAESRRAWLQITVDGETNDEVALLGAYDDATGEIDAPEATRVYRAEHGTWDGSAAIADGHLVLHDSIIEDTRIPPKGFVPDATTMPVGAIDFSDGDGGYVNFDEVTLTVTLPDDFADSIATLRVGLLYQSMTRSHVDFLASENTTNDAGQVLLDAYEATDSAPPLLVASATSDITLPDTTGPGGGAGGGGGTGATSTASTAAGPTTSAAATAGAGGEGGGDEAKAPAGNASPSDCGCRTAGAPEDRGWLAVMGALALGGAVARRARRRAPSSR